MHPCKRCISVCLHTRACDCNYMCLWMFQPRIYKLSLNKLSQLYRFISVPAQMRPPYPLLPNILPRELFELPASSALIPPLRMLSYNLLAWYFHYVAPSTASQRSAPGSGKDRTRHTRMFTSIPCPIFWLVISQLLSFWILSSPISRSTDNTSAVE